MGVINIIVLHYAILILIYLPIYFILHKSRSSINSLDEVAFILHALSPIPYLALQAMYHRIARRWNENERKVDTYSSEDDIRSSLDDLDVRRLQDHSEQSVIITEEITMQNVRRGDVFRDCTSGIEPSYMAKNMPLINLAIAKRNNQNIEANS